MLREHHATHGPARDRDPSTVAVALGHASVGPRLADGLLQRAHSSGVGRYCACCDKSYE
jgi:hypothetical protein